MYPLVRRFGSMDAFYDHVVDGIRRLDASTEIVFKGHPDMRGKAYYVPQGVRDITHQNADEALEGCKVLVVGTSLLGELAYGCTCVRALALAFAFSSLPSSVFLLLLLLLLISLAPFGAVLSAGLAAVLRGIPVIALDPEAPGWPIVGHHLEQLADPPRLEREPFLHTLAYTMWSKAEIRNGDMFDFLTDPETYAACPAGRPHL